VLEQQKVDSLGVDFGNHPDPELFAVYARIKNVKDVDDVRQQVLATFARFTTETVNQTTLDATRSRMRYSFALRMNSSPAIAASLAPYILLKRTPDTINRVFQLYQQITPQDVRAGAARVFVDRSSTIVTLATKAGTP
jgi:zinc protease